MYPRSMADSDCVIVMGSNMAECHPVAFRWPMQAKAKGATLIHVDPRFTRTSAMADVYAPLRAGSDIVFLGALIKHTLDQLVPIFAKPAEQLSAREQFHRDYIVRYTNGATIIASEFKDTEADDLAGIFAGYDAEIRGYDVR